MWEDKLITIKFFAVLREVLGTSEMNFETSFPSTCEKILIHLGSLFPHLTPLLSSCLIAVNGSYASPKTFLSEGDELALLPPASGG